MIDAGSLRRFAPNCDAEALAPSLDAACRDHGITTLPRVVHFLAQAYVETAGFTTFVENLNYSAAGLLKTWPQHFNALTAEIYQHQPEKIANRAYANRMGNGDEASGDGWRYRGRGPVQATGRAAYAEAASATGLDLLDHPELLEGIGAAACEAAAAFWEHHGCNELADADDLVAITRAITGGLSSLPARQAALDEAEAIWTPATFVAPAEAPSPAPQTEPSPMDAPEPIPAVLTPEDDISSIKSMLQQLLAAKAAPVTPAVVPSPPSASPAPVIAQQAPPLAAGGVALAAAALGAVQASGTAVNLSSFINALAPYLIVGVLLPLAIWITGRVLQSFKVNAQSVAGQSVVQAVQNGVMALAAQGVSYADAHANVEVHNAMVGQVIAYARTAVPQKLAASGITPTQLATLVTNRLALLTPGKATS